MTVDALAYEPQFLDHLAPLWRALPESARGTFLVEPSLIDRAVARGVDAVATPRPTFDRGQPIPPNVGYRPALVASYGDTKEARRLGYGPLAYIEHGIGQSYGKVGASANASYAGGTDRSDTTLFLMPGPTPAARWRDAYPGARVEIVGSPRLDDLPRRVRGERPVIAVSFHWNPSLAVSPFAGTAIGEYHRDLARLAERYDVIGHAHPKTGWQDRVRHYFERARIPFYADFDDICRLADLYVCDNSSTIYEFAATGRPVVLMNAREWRRGPELGLRFWSAAHVGLHLTDGVFDDAIIDRALAERPEDVADRENALALVYGYRSGASERAAAIVVDWLSARGEAAA